MTYDQFKNSLQDAKPAEELSPYLSALWYDARDQWEKAHELVQDLQDDTASWIHAYLHRKEGDSFNADYWYRRAGKKRPESTLEKEWEQITRALLQ